MILPFFPLIIFILASTCHGWKSVTIRSSRRFSTATTTTLQMNSVLTNDLMIRAARGEVVERTPVWVFRQAGRHLPEYNDYKTQRGKNFLELLQDPIDVAECTLQPIRRYDLDAAILFSDILVVLQALGIEVTMPGGLGITVPHPLVSADEVYSRLPQGSINIQDKLAHVIEAVKLIKKELKNKVPLIGFSAAPWTLMYYLVGGSSKKNQQVATHWLENHPVESTYVLDKLTDVIIDYLSAQVEAGADMLQVFEAMGDYISEQDFYTWALPRLERIRVVLKERYPHIPVLVFPRGACYSIASLQAAGYDVVTIDTKTSRQAARKQLAHAADEKGLSRPATIQGNLDVNWLIGGKAENTPERVEKEVEKLLHELGPQRLIANLGEGLTGKEDPVLVAKFIDAVHEKSAAMIMAEVQ